MTILTSHHKAIFFFKFKNIEVLRCDLGWVLLRSDAADSQLSIGHRCLRIVTLTVQSGECDFALEHQSGFTNAHFFCLE